MPEITYLDFDLLILPVEAGFQARVLASPAGEANYTFHQPFTVQELVQFQAGLTHGTRHLRTKAASKGSNLESIKTLGGKLFQTVFQGDVLTCFQNSLRQVETQNLGLRIRLRLNDVPALAQIPWEYLYQPELNRFVVASHLTPLVRYTEQPEPIKPINITTPLRVLVMISNPQEHPLNVEDEWKKLRDTLSELEQKGLVKLERIEANRGKLQRALRKNQYHVFHFIGHGGFDAQSDDGLLLFETATARQKVTGEQLATLLHDTSLRLVLLNACEGAKGSSHNPFSGVAQHLVRQGIPAVIAMREKITDQSAITFAQNFYQAISDGYPIDAALGEARKALFIEDNTLEWGIPVLYMRTSDARIFKIESPQPKSNQLVRVGDYLGPATRIKPKTGPPASLVKARQLIAREQHLKALEQAGSSGKAVLLIGPHGIGKTRLVQEFMQRQGHSLTFKALPLEAKDSNATFSRILYELLRGHPDLEIEYWMVQELARIVPEFGNAPTVGSDRQRFSRAIERLFELILTTVQTIVFEDLDLADPASLEELWRVFRTHWGQATSTRIICTFKALPEAATEPLLESVNSEQAALIELRPFDTTQIRSFLQSLEPKLKPDQVQEFASVLEERGETSPGRILDSLNIWHSHGAQGPLEDRQHNAGLIRQQFKALSTPAKHLAVCFALNTVNMELAEKVLKTKLEKLDAPLEELREAKIISNNAFANDEIGPLILEETDDSIEVLIHKKSAQALERIKDRPALIAAHWEAAGEHAKAAPQWRKAAETAEATYRFVEAADLFEHSSDEYLKADDAGTALRMLKKQTEMMSSFDLGPRFLEVLDRMFKLAHTPYFRAGVLQTRAEYFYRIGNTVEAEKAATAGYEQAEMSQDAQQKTTLLSMLGVVYWMQKQFAKAIKTYLQALEFCENWGDLKSKGDILMNIGVAYKDQSQYEQAQTYFEQAIKIFTRLPDEAGQARQAHALANMGAGSRDRGHTLKALTQLQAALDIYHSRVQDDKHEILKHMRDDERRVMTQLAEVHRDLGNYKQALEYITTAHEIATALGVAQNRIKEVRGHIWMFLGQLEQAEADFDSALDETTQAKISDDMQASILFKKIRLYTWLGRDATNLLETAKTCVQRTESKTLQFQMNLFEGLSKTGEAGLEYFKAALEVAQQHQLDGLEMIVHARIAQCLLEMNQISEALEHSQTAMALLEQFSPSGSYPAEIMYIRYLIIKQTDTQAAEVQLKNTKTWVLDVAEKHVDTEHVQEFLQRNTVNQTIFSSEGRQIA
jgi:tetratricopeptide (TPR) repeat protein